MNQFVEKYRNWKLKNTFFLIVSIVLLFYFANTLFVKNIIYNIGNLGYLGVFIVGIFFVSTFTVAPASIVLFYLSKEIHPLEIALIAGLGAALGDYLIFRFLKDRVFEELKPIFLKFGDFHFFNIFSTPYFAWLAPVVGAIIIASPFPDELGISLLGISDMKNWKFLILSFVLNSVGIFLIVAIANFL